MKKVSVNLLTYNADKYLPQCLDSLFQQTYKDWELLIIDNASTDGTINWLKNCSFPHRLIRNSSNAGFAVGHNQGIKETNSEFILLLNQDIVLEPDYLMAVVKILDQKPQAAAVQGKILRWNFTPISHDLPALTNQPKSDIIDSAGLYAYRSCRFVERGQGMKDQGQFDQLEQVFGATGALPLYRRQDLEIVKVNQEYFDPDFFYLKEDIDLAWRLRLAGFEAWYQPPARAYHHRTNSIEIGDYRNKNLSIIKNRRGKTRLARYHSFKNQQLLLIKNLDNQILKGNFLHIFWYEFKQLAYGLIFEPRLWSVLFQVKKLLPKMLSARKIIHQRKKNSFNWSLWFK